MTEAPPLPAPGAPLGHGHPPDDRRPGTASRDGAASRRHLALLGLSLLGLAVAYALLAASLSRYHAVWSADSGALLAMAQGNLSGHGPALLAYDNAALDPDGRIHPLAFFVRRGPRGLFLEFLPLFSWLSAFALRAFGFGGLALLPLCCGLGTTLTVALTARRLGLPGWPLVPLVMGLATPLMIYSVVFWHHTPLMLAAALAGLFLLRALDGPDAQGGRGNGDVRFGALAGAALGVGTCLHELSLLLFVAVLVTLPLLPRSARRVRLAAGLLAGFLPCLLVWALSNRLLYGLWGGPHVGGNVDNLRQHLSGWQALLDPPHLVYRVWLQLVGAEGGAPGARLLAWLLAGAVLSGRLGRRWPLAAPWLSGGACLAAAACGLSLLPARVPFSGLFAATPLLLPALLPAASLRPSGAPPGQENSLDTFLVWAGRACPLFAALVLLNPVQPGMDWGSRYLLTALPWLLLLSLCAWRRVWQGAAGHGRPAALAALAAMALLSLSAQVRGLAAVRRDLAFSRELIETARRAPGPVLVTDLAWLGPELVASPTPLPPQFLVRSGDDRRLLLDTLRARNTADSKTAGLTNFGFTYMGSFEGLDPLARAVAHADPPLVVTRTWEGAGLRLARFAPRPAAGTAKAAPAKSASTKAASAKAASPSTGAPALPHVPGSPRRVLAMYYPWYATPAVSGHWSHQEGVDVGLKHIASHTHYPLFGPYDSADPKVIERHLTQAKAAGIDTLVCSWWGATDPTDKALRLLLRRAPAHGMTACVYWERPARPGDPKAAEAELASLLGTVGQAPGYLKVGGRPVVFLYDQTCRSLTPEQWAAVLKGAARRVPPGVLAIGSGASADGADAAAPLWGGWHTLDTPGALAGPGGKPSDPAAAARAQAALFERPIARARRQRGVSVETVEPGFDDRSPNAAGGHPPGPLLDRAGGALYRGLWEQAIKDGPDWVLVNSFNEWHNGTEIEPSVEEGEEYLTLTRREADRFRGTSGTKPSGP